MDFSAFFSAFFSNWVGYMSGIGSVLLTIFGFTRPKANEKKTFIIAGIICLLLAPIHIWTLEHRARVAAEDANTPNLSMEIGMTSIGQRVPDDLTVITLDLRMVNKGAPSTFNVGNPEVYLSNGTRVPAIIMLNNSKNTGLSGAPGQLDTILLSKNHISKRVMGEPIPRGGGLTGWLQLALPGTPQQVVAAQGTKIIINCIDINGKTFSATKIADWRGVPDKFSPENYPIY